MDWDADASQADCKFTPSELTRSMARRGQLGAQAYRVATGDCVGVAEEQWTQALCVLTCDWKFIVVFLQVPVDPTHGSGAAPTASAVAFEPGRRFAWVLDRAGCPPVRTLFSGVTSVVRRRFQSAFCCRAKALKLCRLAGLPVEPLVEFGSTHDGSLGRSKETPSVHPESPGATPVLRSPELLRSGIKSPLSVRSLGREGVRRVGDVVAPIVRSLVEEFEQVATTPASTTPGVGCTSVHPRVLDTVMELETSRSVQDSAPFGWDEELGRFMVNLARSVVLGTALPSYPGGCLLVGSQRFVAMKQGTAPVFLDGLVEHASRESWWLLDLDGASSAHASGEAVSGLLVSAAELFEGDQLHRHFASGRAGVLCNGILLRGGDPPLLAPASDACSWRSSCLGSAALAASRVARDCALYPTEHTPSTEGTETPCTLEERVRRAVEAAKALRDRSLHPEELEAQATRAALGKLRMIQLQQEAAAALHECRQLARGVVPHPVRESD
jgi:hypothetical protein